jgi:hypothetical protein
MPFDRAIFDALLMQEILDMPWDYETGREESTPYSYSGKGGPLSPKAVIWSDNSLYLYSMWQAVESEAARCTSRDKVLLMAQAAVRFKTLEANMTFYDSVKTAEARREYISWLAKKNGTKWQPPPVTERDIVDSLPFLNQLVHHGFRTLAKSAHPDKGGSTAEFERLKKARDVLDNLIKEVGEAI